MDEVNGPDGVSLSTTSQFPFRWWGANPTLSDRHQLDEPPGPHSAQHEALAVPKPRYVNSRGYAGSTRSASFPTDGNKIMTRFVPSVGPPRPAPAPHGQVVHRGRFPIACGGSLEGGREELREPCCSRSVNCWVVACKRWTMASNTATRASSARIYSWASTGVRSQIDCGVVFQIWI